MYRRIFGNKYFLSISIAIVIVISWVGVLDEYSDNYTDASIIEAGASYAIARGINGIVSVLQTSTVQVGAGISGSMAFGEVLDPINDLIERFSHVMSLALGSLVFQKILLGISAHGVFKLLIALSGATLIFAFLVRNNTVTSLASRVFAFLIFIRFSLVIVVLLNSVVDNAFITKQIASGTDGLREFRDDVSQLKENSGNLKIDRSAYEESIRDDRLKIDEIEKTVLPNLKWELANENSQLMAAETDLEEIQQQRGWADRLNPFNENKLAVDAERKISIHERKLEELRRSIEDNAGLMEQLRDEIEISKKRLAGEPVGILEKINNELPSISGLKRSLSMDVIEENITETVNNIFHLSALFVLKTILIPLGFFFVFIKGLKKIWKADLTGIFSNQEKLT